MNTKRRCWAWALACSPACLHFAPSAIVPDTIDVGTVHTMNAARQYGEDLVILSTDPFALPVERLLELKVVETTAHGRQVYAAP